MDGYFFLIFWNHHPAGHKLINRLSMKPTHGMDIMKKTTLKNGCRSLLLLATLGLTSGAMASQANTKHYVRNDCNEQADGLSGEARRQAIAQCIRKKAQSDNMPPMLAKVSECNRKAGDMSGDARSSFMDNCMKNN